MIPVSSTCVEPSCSSNDGAGRWISHFSSVSGWGLLSTASPSRLNILPRVCLPTGTFIDAPVSTAGSPLTSPSVLPIAMQRTVSSPICCATSTVSFLPSCSISMALSRLGRCSGGNFISSTAPIICTTVPIFCGIDQSCPFLLIQRISTRYDLVKLIRDLFLSCGCT